LPHVTVPRGLIVSPGAALLDTFALMTPVALCPFFTVPRWHTTLRPAGLQCFPPDTNASDFGSVVLNTALPDFPGPLAVTVNVHS
jgi:hypothetical protein